MDRLRGKVALISGSARGQGESEARLFVGEGARVIVSDVLDDAGTALAEELGPDAMYVHLDVTSPDQWRGAVTAGEGRFGPVDVLVNNAGIGAPGRPLDEMPEQDHHRTIEVNLHGVWNGMRAVVPSMRRAGGGSIVNVSSMYGVAGCAWMTTYVASKFAVTGMTRSAALELGRDGIRVNSVHPGLIDTPMLDGVSDETRESQQRYLARQPIARIGTPEEVAHLVLFLASDEASYCTGAQFVVDGGHTAGPYREVPAFDTE